MDNNDKRKDDKPEAAPASARSRGGRCQKDVTLQHFPLSKKAGWTFPKLEDKTRGERKEGEERQN